MVEQNHENTVAKFIRLSYAWVHDTARLINGARHDNEANIVKGSHLPHATRHSPVAQSVERLPVKQNVTGSNPVGRVRRGIA